MLHQLSIDNDLNCRLCSRTVCASCNLYHTLHVHTLHVHTLHVPVKVREPIGGRHVVLLPSSGHWWPERNWKMPPVCMTYLHCTAMLASQKVPLSPSQARREHPSCMLSILPSSADM